LLLLFSLYYYYSFPLAFISFPVPVTLLTHMVLLFSFDEVILLLII